MVDRMQYYAHRLAWFYVHGKWPKLYIDHINRNKSDNRICNLREATAAQNAQNSHPLGRGISGAKGVTWHAQSKLWHAKIKINSRNICLGYYPTIQEAAAAYRGAVKATHTHAPQE